MPPPLDWHHVSGMYPFDVLRTVLHLLAPGSARAHDGAEAAAEFESAHGWSAHWREVETVEAAADEVGRAAPDVVVLHGRRAGALGRLAVRGRIPTVYRPRGPVVPSGRAGASGLVRPAIRWRALAWERWAARWTNLLVLDRPEDAVAAVADGVRAPLLIVTPLDERKLSAAIGRAHAFGRGGQAPGRADAGHCR